MADKEFEPEDPLELVGVSLPEAGPEVLEECLVEEYIRDGWGDEELMGLFRNPVYVLTHRIYRERGEAYVSGLIAALRRKWGYWKVGARGVNSHVQGL